MASFGLCGPSTLLARFLHGLLQFLCERIDAILKFGKSSTGSLFSGSLSLFKHRFVGFLFLRLQLLPFEFASSRICRLISPAPLFPVVFFLCIRA